jgi:hypothetical protein
MLAPLAVSNIPTWVLAGATRFNAAKQIVVAELRDPQSQTSP